MLEYFIGINALPNAASKMCAERMYAVVHNDTAPVSEWLCRILIDASSDRPAIWISEGSPERVLNSSSAVAQTIRTSLVKGDIRIFETGSVEAVNPGRAMREELDFLGNNKGSLLVIEGADRFVGSPNSEVWDVIAWQRWVERSGCALLWLFPKRVGRTDPELDIVRVAQRFSGYARLRKSDNEVRWDVFHWFGEEGLIADKSYRLTVQQDQPWKVETIETRTDTGLDQAADEDEVLITRTALGAGKPANTNWRVFETPDKMYAALSTTTAATTILHYSSDTSLEQFARAIFEIRRATGPRTKIAVREIGGRLRHSHEQLLLNLGANLIVPAEISFSRMVKLIDTIQGQVYSRPLQADYEATIASVMPAAKMGYLSPDNFISSVTEAMERARALSIQNALIRFPLTVGLGVAETLRCCSMKRPGDLCTADSKSVYVFLFACEEADIELTLDRLFRLPVSVLFAGELRYLKSADIAGAIAELSDLANSTHLPDLTAELSSVHGGVPDVSDHPASRVKPGQQAVRVVTPAVRKPLKLRMNTSRIPA